MRFGKTFAAYQLAKQMGIKSSGTHLKPAVESAWKKTLPHISTLKAGSLSAERLNSHMRRLI